MSEKYYIKGEIIATIDEDTLRWNHQGKKAYSRRLAECDSSCRVVKMGMDTDGKPARCFVVLSNGNLYHFSIDTEENPSQTSINEYLQPSSGDASIQGAIVQSPTRAAASDDEREGTNEIVTEDEEDDDVVEEENENEEDDDVVEEEIENEEEDEEEDEEDSAIGEEAISVIASRLRVLGLIRDDEDQDQATCSNPEALPVQPILGGSETGEDLDAIHRVEAVRDLISGMVKHRGKKGTPYSNTLRCVTDSLIYVPGDPPGIEEICCRGEQDLTEDPECVKPSLRNIVYDPSCQDTSQFFLVEENGVYSIYKMLMEASDSPRLFHNRTLEYIASIVDKSHFRTMGGVTVYIERQAWTGLTYLCHLQTGIRYLLPEGFDLANVAITQSYKGEEDEEEEAMLACWNDSECYLIDNCLRSNGSPYKTLLRGVEKVFTVESEYYRPEAMVICYGGGVLHRCDDGCSFASFPVTRIVLATDRYAGEGCFFVVSPSDKLMVKTSPKGNNMVIINIRLLVRDIGQFEKTAWYSYGSSSVYFLEDRSVFEITWSHGKLGEVECIKTFQGEVKMIPAKDFFCVVPSDPKADQGEITIFKESGKWKTISLKSGYLIAKKPKINRPTHNVDFPGHGNHYHRLLSYIDMSNLSNSIYSLGCRIRRGNSTVSSGDGVTSELTSQVIAQFAEENLVMGRFVQFHPRVYRYPPEYLRNIGKLLLITFPWTGLRSFPLIFFIILKKTVFGQTVSVEDLEYFAQDRDPEAFQGLLKLKEADRETLAESGFDSYPQALIHFCELEEPLKKQSILLPMVSEFRLLAIHCVKLNLGSIENMLLDKESVQVPRSEMVTKIQGKRSSVDESEIKFRIESLDDEQFTNLLLNWSGKDRICANSTYYIEFFKPNYDKQKKGKEGEVNYHTCSQTIRASTDFLRDLDSFMTTITTYNAGFNTV